MTTLMVSNDGADDDVLLLKLGGVRSKERIYREVARASDDAGTPVRRVTPNAAVTIASWWNTEYPVLTALTDHSAASRASLIATTEQMIEDCEAQGIKIDSMTINALRALKYFVSSWDE